MYELWTASQTLTWTNYRIVGLTAAPHPIGPSAHPSGNTSHFIVAAAGTPRPDGRAGPNGFRVPGVQKKNPKKLKLERVSHIMSYRPASKFTWFLPSQLHARTSKCSFEDLRPRPRHPESRFNHHSSFIHPLLWKNMVRNVNHYWPVGGFNHLEKYESQLGWWHSQYMKNKSHVPNHQPDYITIMWLENSIRSSLAPHFNREYGYQ